MTNVSDVGKTDKKTMFEGVFCTVYGQPEPQDVERQM